MNEEKNHIDITYVINRFIRGVKNLLKNRIRISIVIILLIVWLALLVKIELGRTNLPFDTTSSTEFLIVIVGVLMFIGTAYLMGAPFNAMTMDSQLLKIGLKNRFDEAPKLLEDLNREMVFYSPGIPLSEWKQRQEEIEAALNVHILDIIQGYDMQTIRVRYSSGNQQLPDYVRWDRRYENMNPAVISIGVDCAGIKKLDFSSQPHVIVQGVTGSGKTVITKGALDQMYQKGASILLFDGKGLVDFTEEERQHYKCDTTRESFKDDTEAVIEKYLEGRKKLFQDNYISNIDVWNKMHPEMELNRIIIASDEVAMLFLKSSDKTEKELTSKITALLTVIATQGRAYGIHLWLATQRGDADLIPAQVRANINTRICGRADEVLSQLAVGHTGASLIPKSIKGRFVDDEGDYFQAFDYIEGSKDNDKVWNGMYKK